MLQRLAEINFLAVAVAGLATFFLGAVWYMPLFGKLWKDLHNFSEERLKAMQARMPMPLFFGVMIVCYLLISALIALLIVLLNVKAPGDALILGFVLWLIVAAVGLTGQISSDRHYGIYAIDVGYQFVYLHFMCVLLTMWR